MLALPVVGQKAVDVAAGHSAIGAHRAVDLAAGELEQRLEGAGGAADMYFIPRDGPAAADRFARDLDQHLVAFQDRIDVEQAETLDFRRGPLDAVWIGDAAAEHLIAAADSQDRAAAPQMGPEVDVPAELPERGEIGDGRLRARQDDQRGIARHGLVGPEKDEIDARIQSPSNLS